MKPTEDTFHTIGYEMREAGRDGAIGVSAIVLDVLIGELRSCSNRYALSLPPHTAAALRSALGALELARGQLETADMFLARESAGKF